MVQYTQTDGHDSQHVVSTFDMSITNSTVFTPAAVARGHLHVEY